MIVVDSSALVAVVLDEPDRGFLTSILAAATTRICSQVSFVETAMVLTGKTHRLPMSELEAALAVLKVEQVDLDTRKHSWRLKLSDVLAEATTQPSLISATAFPTLLRNP